MEYAKPIFIRYHYDIGFPKYVGDMCLEFFGNFQKVSTTFHSSNQLVDDGKGGPIPLPTRADLLAPQNTLVELYEQVDKYDNPAKIMQKVLIRIHHMSAEWDYSFVVARDGYLISAWANAKTDIHKLKNRHVYFSNFYKDEVELPEALWDDDDGN